MHQRRKPGQSGPSRAEPPASQGGAGFLPLPGCCPCWEENQLPRVAGIRLRVQGVTSSGTLPGWEGWSAPQGFLLFNLRASRSPVSSSSGVSPGSRHRVASPGASPSPWGPSHLQQVCGCFPSCCVCRVTAWMTGVLSRKSALRGWASWPVPFSSGSRLPGT